MSTMNGTPERPTLLLEPSSLPATSPINMGSLSKELLQESEEIKRKKKEELRKRQQLEATKEILQTEITYVNNLQIFEKVLEKTWVKINCKVFMKPLRENPKILSLEDYQTCFMDIEVITNVNAELLKSLKDWFRANNLLSDGVPVDTSISDNDRTLGKIFQKMVCKNSFSNQYHSVVDSIFEIL